MYKWTAIGQYITAGKLKGTQDYEEVFELEEGNLSKARAIIQNGLLSDRLRKKDNYYRWRTCQLLEEPEKEVGTSEDPELEKLLSEATERGCIPINLNSIGNNKLKKQELKAAIKKSKEALEKHNKKKGKKKVQVKEEWSDE